MIASRPRLRLHHVVLCNWHAMLCMVAATRQDVIALGLLLSATVRVTPPDACSHLALTQRDSEDDVPGFRESRRWPTEARSRNRKHRCGRCAAGFALLLPFADWCWPGRATGNALPPIDRAASGACSCRATVCDPHVVNAIIMNIRFLARQHDQTLSIQ